MAWGRKPVEFVYFDQLSMKIQINHQSKIPLHTQVEELIRKLIDAPEYQNGAFLPKEVELANRLGVSRNTIRQATNKLEYEGTGELAQTDTCCKLLDPKTARCKDYKNRKKIVPDCIQLTPSVVAKMDWLPKTCGYRLVHFKQDLYWWHPLVSGDPETVHAAGISAKGRVIPEDQVEDITERVVDWFA